MTDRLPGASPALLDNVARREQLLADLAEAAATATGASAAGLVDPDRGAARCVRGSESAIAAIAAHAAIRAELVPGRGELIRWTGSELGLEGTVEILMQPLPAPAGRAPLAMVLAFDRAVGSGADRLLTTLAVETARQLLVLESSPIYLRALNDAACGITIADARLADAPLVYANDAFCRLTGYRRAQVLGRNCRFLQNGAGGGNEAARATLRTAMADGTGATVTLANRTAQGRNFTNELTLTAVHDAEGNLAYLLGLQRDVTRRETAEQQLDYEQRRIDSLLATSPVHIWTMPPEGGVQAVSQPWLVATGMDADSARGWGWTEALQTDDAAAYAAHWAEASPDGLPFEIEYRVTDQDGRERRYTDHLSPVQGDDGGILEWVGVTTEVTALRKAEMQLLRRVYEDQLTGLLTETGFTKYLNHRFYADSDSELMGFVVAFDLSGFSDVNESFGRNNGDALLAAIAERLRDQMGPHDLLARLAEDRFALYLAAATHGLADAAQAHTWLDGCFAAPFALEGLTVAMDSWQGVAAVDSTCSDGSEALQRAELALHQARRLRGALWATYDQDLEIAARQRLVTTRGLHEALGNNDFALVYQPKVRLADRALAGAEALLRWHVDGKLLSPASFMAVAESSQLIMPIGAWVLRQACQRLARWQHAGLRPAALAVNVSRVQLSASDFPALVSQVLAETGADPAGLTLEITETALERDPAKLQADLSRLVDLGVKLALDDFGIGYSSLGYLQAYPFHEIKIDRSFTQAAIKQDYSREIVRLVISLAAIKGAVAVAEGIEVEGERDLVHALGGGYGQGFLFARPMPVDLYEALLRRSGGELPPAPRAS